MCHFQNGQEDVDFKSREGEKVQPEEGIFQTYFSLHLTIFQVSAFLYLLSYPWGLVLVNESRIGFYINR